MANTKNAQLRYRVLDKCLFFYDDSGGVVVSANDSDDFVGLVTV